MGRRHPNHRLVKIHRTYTVEEIARLLGIHKNTVRNWLKAGLKAIDNRRPTLVQGRVLIDFLKERRSRNKQKLKPGEIYCVRCRAAVRPAGRIADFVPITETTGNLRGICPTCDLLIHRHTSLPKLAFVRGDLEVTLRPGGQHIAGSPVPTLTCDSGR